MRPPHVRDEHDGLPGAVLVLARGFSSSYSSCFSSSSCSSSYYSSRLLHELTQISALRPDDEAVAGEEAVRADEPKGGGGDDEVIKQKATISFFLRKIFLKATVKPTAVVVLKHQFPLDH